jgi:peroxiredoxin
MISPGDQAPAFELPTADLEMLTSEDLAGKSYVMYFYPKDDTPGCIMEAQEFSDLSDEFAGVNCEIIGVSKDNCVSHATFRDKYGLTVQLIADVEGQVCDAYGVWQEKEAHGEKRMGIVRSTFVIDDKGLVRHAIYNVKPKGHAEAVLELVKAL